MLRWKPRHIYQKLMRWLLRTDLLKKLQKEKTYYTIQSENIQEEIEEKRITAVDMEMRLSELKRDLARSHNLLDLLRDNGN